MLPEHKKTLKSLVLTLRHLLEGHYDESGVWHPGDLERRLNALGVFVDREVPLHDMGQLSDADRRARNVADAYIAIRDSAGVPRETAVREYVRESAHTWANRLVALRMMEARGLIDEVVLARVDYGNRSLEHHRALQANPSLRSLEDEGLASVFEDIFIRMSDRLPNLFEPKSPATALRPSTTALKKAVALLSGADAPRGQQPADDGVFIAPDALGWAYQYWNTEEKDRVFEAVRTKKAKISGDDIIPATQLYTEPYMVKFLVQNSLGATWMCMHPDSKLSEGWEYYVADADREPMDLKEASELTFLDPACGSGHFLLEAFDMLFDFYEEEGERDASAIATSILERNLFGIDIDERAVQIAEAALWMRAAERVVGFTGLPTNLLATNIRLPQEKAGVDAYLAKHPEDAPLRPALEAVLSSLQHADELGSLLKLEEPIEDELKTLERAFERSSARGTQIALFGDTPAQGELPVGVSSYDEWKLKVVRRLAEHFHEEAVSADAGSAWFGRSAGKGIKLFELLSRHYDVVTANPPYMGSGNMGAAVKRYVELNYPLGKADLYAAFILRDRELCADLGRFGMVTQQTWMFLQTYADLRAMDSHGLLVSTALETIAHLGNRAFAEISGEVVSTVLFVAAKRLPSEPHHLWAARLTGQSTPAGKARSLRDGESTYRLAQGLLLGIPQAPVSYWLPSQVLRSLSGKVLADVAHVYKGSDTGEDARFVRFAHESPPSTRWIPLEKGAGYGRWGGHQLWSVDWQADGARLKATDSATIRNPQYIGKPCWVYSFMAGGNLGLRKCDGALLGGGAACGVMPMREDVPAGLLVGNRLGSYVVRALSGKLQLNESYVSRIPFPVEWPCHLLALESLLVALGRTRAERDLVERECIGNPNSEDTWLHDALLATAEAYSESAAFAAHGLDEGSISAILSETGVPGGFHPMVHGLDTLPTEPEGLPLPNELIDHVSRHARVSVQGDALVTLRLQMRSLYAAGPGSHDGDMDSDTADVEPTTGALIRVPAETFIEELSQKLEIHPISVYWLLKEGVENDGWRCIPEERKELTRKVTILVLRALGHRWPKEIQAGDPVAHYADSDGVIPISEGTDEAALIERLRDVIEKETGVAAPTFEAHFADAMGISLETWLATKFFAHHVAQFKKRPIAWHLVSSRPTARRRPVFSALVYYHALDADLIPKLRSHYLSPLRRRAETELRSIEATSEAARSAEQVTRRAELDERIAELKDLDERLEAIERGGFESPELTKLTATENIDSFCSIDGIKPKPIDTDAFFAQERAYLPDLNDGVRVNISPWQKAGVLAAEVLAKKDIDKAIADRARWRSDERRWCREGKLPRPGWWPEG